VAGASRLCEISVFSVLSASPSRSPLAPPLKLQAARGRRSEVRKSLSQIATLFVALTHHRIFKLAIPLIHQNVRTQQKHTQQKEYGNE
jgi:hypothetical protein